MTPKNGSLFIWPRKPQKNLENTRNHANQEVQIFMFTFRTLVKLPRPLRACISKKPPNRWRMLLYRSNLCHSVVTMAELVGELRPNSGAVGGRKRVLNYYCSCSKIEQFNPKFYRPNNQAQAPLSQESIEGVLQLMEDAGFRKVRTHFSEGQWRVSQEDIKE